MTAKWKQSNPHRRSSFRGGTDQLRIVSRRRGRHGLSRLLVDRIIDRIVVQDGGVKKLLAVLGLEKWNLVFLDLRAISLELRLIRRKAFVAPIGRKVRLFLAPEIE